MIIRTLSICLFLAVAANIALSQVNTFPYSESFEQSFTTGDNVAFITNWTGNDVNSSNRIYQGGDARTGSSSLNVVPTSSFSGEILISLDLSGVNNPKMTFYAFSKQNGSSSSTRPALLSFSTSIDGGTSFLDDVAIGDETTFPNNNTTSYAQYEYELPVAASGASNVIIKMTIARGNGSGSSAELVMDDVSIEEQLIPLAISSVSAASSTSVVVTYNQEVTQSTAENIGNYAINNDVSVNAASRTEINEVTLTTSVMANNNYSLTVNNVEDAASNTPASNLQDSFSFIEPLTITSTTVTNKNTIELLFNLDLDQASAETTVNYSIDNSIGNPAAAALDDSNSKKVILSLGSDLLENNYTITVDNVTDASSLAVASGLNDSFSYLPLSISSISATSATTLEVTFNQNVDGTTAAIAANYSLNFGLGNPASAVVSSTNAALVTLTFSGSMVNNTYELSVNNVDNSSGNATATGLTADVTYTTATLSRQIVINEIYADPSGANQPNPQVLPGGSSQEFIELYNASSSAIDLANFDLSGGTIGSHVLEAGSFVILTSSGNVSDFQSFGNTVAVTSWNSLTNGGEQLILKDNLGNIVDSLTYETSWYQDDDKADGGWSLEQINPGLSCSDGNNWIASTDVGGGSPGLQNSVFDNTPDSTGPHLITVSPTSPTSLRVTFNEIMDANSLMNGSFSLDNGLIVSASAPISPSLRATNLTLGSAMTSGTIYELTVSGVTDCAGNAIASGTLSFLFDNEAPVFERFVVKDPQTVDLIFDEALAEAVAETEANYLVDQSIGNPDNAQRNDDDNSRVRLTLPQALSEGSDYIFTYDKLTDTLGNAVSIAMQTLNFTHAIDTVIVNSPQLLDVYFIEALDQSSAENETNYSVDHGIDSPKTALQDDDNAKLIHLVFETSFDDNTDLTIAFEDIRNESNARVQALNTIFVYDTDRPGIDSVAVLDQNNLMVYFDESVDLSSGEAINNYSVNNGLGNPTTATRQLNTKLVQLTFATAFTNEQENTLSISAIRDLAQNELSSTRNIDFVYDELAPSLLALTLMSPRELELSFSEVVDKAIAETLTSYSIDNGIGNPTTATRSTRDSSKVRLEFTGFGNNANNTLSISGMKDLIGNETSEDLISSFPSDQVAIGKLTALTDTTLLLQMTKNLTLSSAEDLSSYQLDNDLTIKATGRDVTNLYQVMLTLSSSMTEDIAYTLSVLNLTDTDGNSSNNLDTEFTYDSQLASINLVNENSLELSFDNALEATAAETPGNYNINNGIGMPVSAVLDNNEAKKVTLIFSADLIEGTNYTLNVSGLNDSFGDPIPASAHAVVYDNTAPGIQSVSSTFTNQITVTFSENLNEAAAETLNHYRLDNGIGTPATAELQSSGNEVLLSFSQDLSDNTTYQLSVNRVEDEQGNAIGSATFDFTFSAPAVPDFRDLVINEIYPDPDASSPLPNVEFVEIYNAGNQAIKLRNFTLSDNSSTASLDIFELAANDYLILTSNANAGLFSGNVMGLTNFPSLSNTGETLYFKRRDGTLIDSLRYTLDFYQDESKESGGYTIELINPSAACFDPANYRASTASTQGTPGAQNSVFDNSPDTTAPSVSGVTVLSDQQLRVTFSESMDAVSIQAADFAISSGETISSISLEDEFGTSVILSLATAFERGISLTLTITNLTDCAGNAIADNANTFFLGATPAANEIVITEIMANPTPSLGLPEVEYLEVFNTSDKILSLDGLSLSDRSGSTTLPTANIQPRAYLLLTSTANTSLFAGIDIRGVSGFPSLNTSGDSLAIANGNNLIFDVVYTTDFYQDETKAEGGYSLEMINPSPACYDNANWIASSNGNGGTPGAQNSVFDNSPDTTVPSVSGVTVLNNQQLRVTFSESMDVGSIQAADFAISSGESISSISLEDEFGTSVIVSLITAFERGISLTLTITNLTDCAGNAIADNANTFFLGATPAANEIVITEIMANPTPSQGLPEVEYLEVFNTSDKILSLDGLSLSDRSGSTTLPTANIQPGAYLLLTSTANTSLFAGIDIRGVSGFPSLNSSGDSLAIANGTDLIFDVVYTTEFYRDETKAEGGYSLEMINPSPACYDNANWIASTNDNGGTPGAQNSVFDNTPDTTAPQISSMEILNEQQFKVTFNESIEVASIDATDFTFSNELQTASVSIENEFGTEVLLNLSTTIPRGNSFDLTVSGITDCSGNAIVSTTRSFVLGAIPLPGQLLITEIMADPIPSQGLPEVDYIEILNTSNITLNLQGLTLADRSTSTILSSINLVPGEYIVLTTNEGARQISGASGVSGFPSLNSSGDLVVIANGATIINAVTYSDDWFRDSQKAEGGVALEMIDINFPCLEASNWRGSDASTGGTPGAVNSVAEPNPDLIGPKLVQAVALNAQQILLTYDEKLAIDNLNINSFRISGGITVNSFLVDDTQRLITLTTNESLESNQLYSIVTDNITDCSGNIITDGFDSEEVVLALEGETGDLLINEILFNPRSGGVRFVEVYNHSTKFLNLKNWVLAGENNERVITENELIVAPGSYLVLTTDGQTLAGEYPGTISEVVFEMSTLPGFANSSGSVSLRNANDLEIDLFDYSADYHSPLLDNVDGVSLERIRFAAITNDPNNWQSASSTTGFATPGYANSQAQENPGQIPDDAVVVEPRTFAPDVAGMAAFTTINFEFDNPGNIINLKVFDANGKLVKDIAQNALVGTEGFFRWDGTTQSGAKARVGYYMILLEVIAPDGIISLKKERVALGTRL